MRSKQRGQAMIMMLVLSSVVLIGIFAFFRISYGKSKIASSSYQSQLLLNITEEIVRQLEVKISYLSQEDLLRIPSVECSVAPCVIDKQAPDSLIKKTGVWWETADKKKIKTKSYPEIEVETYAAIEKLETASDELNALSSSGEVYFRLTVYVKQSTSGAVRRVQAVVSRPWQEGIITRRSWAVH